MRRVIEVEETVKVRHQIFVDVYNDEQIEEAIKYAGDYCSTLDDYVLCIEEIIPVVEINEEYYIDTESVEYFDDYEVDDE